MAISKYEKCCNILNIEVVDENDITESLLKKSYHKCCLKHHPDKRKDLSSSKILEIIDAYDYLCKYLGYIDDDNYDDEEHNYAAPIILNPYIKSVGKMIFSNQFIVSYVESMKDCNFKTIFKLFGEVNY
jgi:DnaJ domain